MNRYQMLINALHVVMKISHEGAVLEAARRALVEAEELLP